VASSLCSVKPGPSGPPLLPLAWEEGSLSAKRGGQGRGLLSGPATRLIEQAHQGRGAFPGIAGILPALPGAPVRWFFDIHPPGEPCTAGLPCQEPGDGPKVEVRPSCLSCSVLHSKG
jgi:hypothetical protein